MILRTVLYIGLVTISTSTQLSGQFLGGSGDGFSIASLTSTLNIYTGGSKDGYATSQSESDLNVFAGGIRDGYIIGNFLYDSSLFQGGNGDGHNEGNFILDFVWTGNVSGVWTESDNWNTNLVPDISRRVTIPRVFTNFPVLSGGLLSIGQDPFNGDYLCRNLTLQDNAIITLQSGTELLNFDSINIYGSVIVNNTSSDAVRNLGDGMIFIRKGGSFIIE